MANPSKIISDLDRDEIKRRLGVKDRMIRAAAATGIPASWYLVVREMCDARGIECPDDAFNFKTPTAPQVAAE